jgi:hypothetical protein
VVGVSLTLVFTACGASTPEEEYVEELNELVSRTRSEFVIAVGAFNQIQEPSVAEAFSFLEREVAIRRELLEGFDSLNPPESLAEVHGALRDVIARLLTAAEMLTFLESSTSSFDELEQAPEMAEYEAANADGSRVCFEVQAMLDELAAASERFDEVPWLDLGLAAQAVLGCGGIEP